MRQYRIIIAFVFSLVCIQVGAQSNGVKLNKAKVDIAMTTLEFLALDKKTFPNVVKEVCKDCSTFESLKQFIKDNELTGANKLVGEWEKINIDEKDWQKSLQAYAEKVSKAITTGSPNKESRKSHPKFPEYQNKLTALQDIQIDENSPGKLIADSPKVGPKDTFDLTGSGSTGSTGTDEESGSWMSYLPYAILAVFVAVFLFIYKNREREVRSARRNKKPSNNSMGTYQTENIEQLQVLRQQIKVLNTKNEELSQQLSDEQRKSQQLEKRLTELSSMSSEPVRTSTRVTDYVESGEITKKYARYADQGDGFTVSELLNEEDDETVFEIVSTSNNTAHFSVTKNANAQRYALMNASYYLARTCAYTNTPTVSSKIKTDHPGKLKLQGNKWHITEPVKISFV